MSSVCLSVSLSSVTLSATRVLWLCACKSQGVGGGIIGYGDDEFPSYTLSIVTVSSGGSTSSPQYLGARLHGECGSASL